MDPQLIELIVQVGLAVVLITIGFTAGRIAERKHFKSLEEREAKHADMLVSDFRSFPGLEPGSSGAQAGAVMVSGAAVISSDYFKTFIAAIKKVIGGELRTYETLLTRARREAIVRMLDEAKNAGFDAVCNIRLDGYDIGGASKGTKKPVVSVTVLASGTAYRRADRAASIPTQPKALPN